VDRNAAQDRVVAAGRGVGFDDPVAGVVDQIGVVAGAAPHAVCARAAGQSVVATAADDGVLAGTTVDVACDAARTAVVEIAAGAEKNEAFHAAGVEYAVDAIGPFTLVGNLRRDDTAVVQFDHPVRPNQASNSDAALAGAGVHHRRLPEQRISSV